MKLAATLSLISAVAFISTTAFAEEPPLQDAPAKDLQKEVDWDFAPFTNSENGHEVFACEVLYGAWSVWRVLIGKLDQYSINTRSQCRPPSLLQPTAIVTVSLNQCWLKIPRPLICRPRLRQLNRPQPQRAKQCFVAPKMT